MSCRRTYVLNNKDHASLCRKYISFSVENLLNSIITPYYQIIIVIDEKLKNKKILRR